MHGDKSQSERSMILDSFLAGECPVLVCTALLGRGIDLPNVSQVSVWSCAWLLYCLSLVTLFLTPLSLTLKTQSFLIWCWDVSCYIVSLAVWTSVN